MANLKNTTVPNITIDDSLTVSQTLASSGIGIYDYKSNGGTGNGGSGIVVIRYRIG